MKIESTKQGMHANNFAINCMMYLLFSVCIYNRRPAWACSFAVILQYPCH